MQDSDEYLQYSKAIQLFISSPLDRKLVKRVTQDLGDIYTFLPNRRNAHSFNDSDKLLNYHLLWVSERPEWSAYPKRTHSICMSINKSDSSYGNYLYYMFPRNDAKLAVCKTNDFLQTFANNKDYVNVYHLNTILATLFQIAGFDDYKTDDYVHLIKMIRYCDDNKSLISDRIPSNVLNIYGNFFKKIITQGIEKTLDSYYNTNKVSLITIEKFYDSLMWYNNEVYVDVPCLGISERYIDTFFDTKL